MTINPEKNNSSFFGDLNHGPYASSLSRTYMLPMSPPVSCLKGYDIWSKSTREAIARIFNYSAWEERFALLYSIPTVRSLDGFRVMG